MSSPARLPWRMGVLWGALFSALVWCLPVPCLTFPVGEGRHSVVGISDDGRYVVLAETGVDDGWNVTYSGRFHLADLHQRRFEKMRVQVPEGLGSGGSGPDVERVREARVAAGRLWIDRSRDDLRISRVSAVDLTTGEESEGEWSASIDGLRNIEFSRDGTRMLTLNFRGDALSVWDLPSSKLVCSIDDAGDQRTLSADGRHVAVYSSTFQSEPLRTVHRWRIYDAETGDVLKERSEVYRDDGATDGPGVHSLEFADGSQSLLSHGVSSTREPTCLIWRWTTGLVTSDIRFSPELNASRRQPRGLDADLDLPQATLAHRWLLISDETPTLRDRGLSWLYDWFPQALAGVRLDGGRQQVWDSRSGRSVLEIPGLYRDVWLSNRAGRLAAIDDNRLQVWSIPPGWPWGRALVGSLVVPLVWGLRRWRAGDGS